MQEGLISGANKIRVEILVLKNSIQEAVVHGIADDYTPSQKKVNLDNSLIIFEDFCLSKLVFTGLPNLPMTSDERLKPACKISSRLRRG